MRESATDYENLKAYMSKCPRPKAALGKQPTGMSIVALEDAYGRLRLWRRNLWTANYGEHEPPDFDDPDYAPFESAFLRKLGQKMGWTRTMNNRRLFIHWTESRAERAQRDQEKQAHYWGG